MDNNKRIGRYRQKIDFVGEKIGLIPKKIDTPLVVDATLYRLQTAIDACMDLVAMLVKDKGMEVSDDYSNIKKLFKSNAITKKLSEDLSMLNGLRNAIVHKYNSFEEEALVENIDEIIEILQNFLEKVENEIKVIFK